MSKQNNNPHNTLLYSQKIKSTADEILHKTDLKKVLEKFGQVFLTGSYKYDLMWDPDIDVSVVTDNPREASRLALQKLIDLQLFQKYQYGDFVNFRMDNRPNSYIINLKLPYANQRWEIEIWFFNNNSKNQHKTDELIKTKINDKNKLTILEAKKNRSENKISKHQLSSHKIYQNILEEK